jgi:hypothetical protein
LQFRFQVAGIVAGAVLAVLFARLFMRAYPELALDQTMLAASDQPHRWASAMTYKIVGALRGLTDNLPHQRTAVAVGIALGLATALLRLLVKSGARYQRFIQGGRVGRMTDFLLDTVVLPSPYASSFGGFVNLPTSVWFALGGVVASVLNGLPRPQGKPDPLPEDMSTTSLVGGGLIAGDALAAVGLGVAGLVFMALG